MVVNLRIALVLLLSCCTTASVATALEIKVRGKAEIEARASSASTMLQVAGRLIDDLGRGVREQSVQVTVSSDSDSVRVARREVNSGAGGTFTFSEELPPGDYRVQVRFDGSEHLDGATSSYYRVRLRKEPITVNAFAPRLVHGRSAVALIHASASTGSDAVVGTAIVSRDGRVVGELDFDGTGRGSLDVGSLLVPGKNTFHVTIPSSAYRDEAIASVTTVFVPALRIEANASDRLDRLRRGISVQGELAHDVDGVELSGVRVRVRLAPDAAASSPILKTLSTDENGRFDVFYPSVELADGTWQASVEAIPPAGSSVRAMLQPVEWSTRVRRTVLNGVWVVALVALVGLMCSYGWIWVKGWYARLLLQRATRRRHEAAFVAEEELVPIELPEVREIIVDAVRGQVFDEWTATPVSNAVVRLFRDSAQLAEVVTDSNGRFEFDRLESGQYRAEVSAHGFVRGVLTLEIPHRGVYSNFRIDLVAVPLKVRRLFQTIMETTSGQDLWGARSPQEIEDLLSDAFNIHQNTFSGREERAAFRESVLAKIDSGEELDGRVLLGAITTVVEESYYSGRRYDESLWYAIRTIGLRLRSS